MPRTFSISQSLGKFIGTNNKEYDYKNFVITDQEKVISIPSLIESESTKTSCKTKNILLQCEEFDPIFVKTTCDGLFITTDDTTRFLGKKEFYKFCSEEESSSG